MYHLCRYRLYIRVDVRERKRLKRNRKAFSFSIQNGIKREKEKDAPALTRNIFFIIGAKIKMKEDVQVLTLEQKRRYAIEKFMFERFNLTGRPVDLAVVLSNDPAGLSLEGYRKQFGFLVESLDWKNIGEKKEFSLIPLIGENIERRVRVAEEDIAVNGNIGFPKTGFKKSRATLLEFMTEKYNQTNSPVLLSEILKWDGLSYSLELYQDCLDFLVKQKTWTKVKFVGDVGYQPVKKK